MNLDFEHAAAVPLGALTALQGLRDCGGLTAGERVVILGASGGVGTFAVPIAKHLGAHVTGIASTPNLDLVRSLGADDVIDYTRDDITERADKFDLVFELGGTRSPRVLRRALKRNGRLVLSSGQSSGRWLGPVDRILLAAVLSPFVSQTLRSFVAAPRAADLEQVARLVESGVLTPVIEGTYPLGELPDALRRIESAHTRGKLVVTV